MGPGYDVNNNMHDDHIHNPLQPPPSLNSGGYQMERDHSNRSNRSQGQPWQNGGHGSDGGYGSMPGHPPGSPALSYREQQRGDRDRGDWGDRERTHDRDRDRSREIDRGRDRDMEPRRSAERKHSQQGSSRTTSGQVRICNKCGEQLTGQFVRALDGTFHLDCFRCKDCSQIVASKFFPADDGNGGPQYPLCETDYFRRLGLLCYHCGGALRGSYITALDRKYHVDHFTCSLCPTVFGAQDSYYEHDGHVYCHYHYSSQFAQRCNGCQTAILKQFVEIFRNGQNQHWHPECYMIHKFWNVRLTAPQDVKPVEPLSETDEAASRRRVREDEEKMEEKVYRIWSVLSTFEESSAACISDMLLHVSNGAYVDGVVVAKRFIGHVEILFRSADNLDATMSRLEMKNLSYGREAKLLCKKIVAFFSLLSKSQDTSAAKLGVTQELLSLVTSLAHYLKLLIRICLQGALRIEKERGAPDGLYQFLDDISALETMKNEPEDGLRQITSNMVRLASNDSDQCTACRKPIEDECAKYGEKRWHLACVKCARDGKELGRSLPDAHVNPYDNEILCRSCDNSEKAVSFEHVTKLQQYVFLLRVALARLLDILHSSGALARALEEDASGNGYAGGGKDDDMRQGAQGNNRLSIISDRDPNREPSSYETTLNDVRRLRSTRLDKHLSSSFRKARTSRVMGGPEDSSARPGSAGGGGNGSNGPDMQIVEDRVDESMADTMLGRQDALTLDDIPHIVAAEQARELRQGGYGRQDPGASGNDQHRGPRSSGDRNIAQGSSFGGGGTPGATRTMSPQKLTGRKYFSELSGLEYFIVRHLAVLTMLPMIEAEFSLEELLGFIESRKPATFWNKFGKAFKNDNKKNIKKKGIFGVPLEVIIERDGADSTDGVGPGTLRIPAIVDDIVSTMRKMDLSVEGVFRKNGNIKKLSELCERIDREGCDSNVLSQQNVVQVAALLKRYLRDLPDPLMTHKLYRLWLAAAKINDETTRRRCLHLTCCLLPKYHRDCLEILFFFLKWAGSFHQVDDESGSKMDIRNIATVIAPNILFVNSKTQALDSDPIFAIDAVDMLITNIEEMCLVPDELVDVLNDPYLFNNNGEITTKEILKRFGDRTVTSGPGQPYGKMGEVMSRHDSSTRPLARRVETDPSVWQDERSVRTVQDAPPVGASIPPYSSAPNQSTPTKWRPQDDAQHVSPYPSQHNLDNVDDQPLYPHPQAHPALSHQQQQQQQSQQRDRDPADMPPPPRQEWRNSGAWGRGNSSGSVGITGV
ncbi:Rho-type GTPase activating protein Rga1 [Sporothrix bragantina]|uniref:Rho-type GTPase activating protein Rga1 n=1 Tax=Sporothrix bragantina TaxID=671064 RepID=A0ABP0CF35_9PEZI